ncbi:MAG: hypothetical protein FWC47_06820 [Oscillospiraceae bacterium]|nr:hypothetical protein [Oscillospiraceae bacterium]
MKIWKKILTCSMIISILLSIEINASSFKVSYSNKVFHYYGGSSGEEDNYSSDFSYTDSFFDESSYEYRHDLATTSLCLAMSAIGIVSAPYSQRANNVIEFMENIGIDDKKIEANDDFTSEPTTNSIGVIAGNKTIISSDGSICDLLVIAIRGGGYEREWGGNLLLGTGTIHEGFDIARNEVKSFLNEYVSNKDHIIAKNRLKVWITGYSRGAAVANLVASDLDKGINDYGFTVNKEDIYAYCFATPAASKASDTSDSVFTNIFSIVNPNDLMPKLAPGVWGYRRYGKTLYLPDAVSSPMYKKEEEDMLTEYYKLSGFDKSRYTLDDFSEYNFNNKSSSLPLSVFLDEFVNCVSTLCIMSPENYTYIYQTFLVNEIGKINSNRSTDDESLSRVLYTLFLFHDFSSKAINSFAANSSLDTLSPNDILTLSNNLNIIPTAHYPELYLAWMRSMDNSSTTFSTGIYRIVRLNYIDSVQVYDSNNALVTSIINNVPEKIEGSSIISSIDDSDEKIFYLPSEEGYWIKLQSTKDGSVAYSIDEFHRDKQDVVRIVNYFDVKIKSGDVLTGTIENLSCNPYAKYELSGNVSSEDLRDEKAVKYRIGVKIQGKGISIGAGLKYRGEFVKLIAVPYKGYKFMGWYLNGNLVSTDVSIRFCVLSNATYTAKFNLK